MLWLLNADGLHRVAADPLHFLCLVPQASTLHNDIAWPSWLPDMIFGKGYPVFTLQAPVGCYLADQFDISGLGYPYTIAQ